MSLTAVARAQLGTILGLLLAASLASCYSDEASPVGSDTSTSDVSDTTSPSDGDSDSTSPSDGDDASSPEDGTDDGHETDETDATRECSAPEDCDGDSTCIGNPEGTYTCMKTCDDVWTLCPDGSVCTPAANGSPICYTGGSTPRGSTCESNLHCAPGLLCVGVENRDYHCLEACHTSEGGCERDEYCNPFGDAGKGYCRQELGSACGSNADCPSNLTCTTSFDPAIRSQFPGGYCTRSGCEDDADCPGETHCRTYPNTEVSLCFAACEDDTSCRLTGDYACLSSDRCDRAESPSNCNDFRDGADFCVPPPLTTWTGE